MHYDTTPQAQSPVLRPASMNVLQDDTRLNHTQDLGRRGSGHRTHIALGRRSERQMTQRRLHSPACLALLHQGYAQVLYSTIQHQCRHPILSPLGCGPTTTASSFCTVDLCARGLPHGKSDAAYRFRERLSERRSWNTCRSNRGYEVARL